MNIKTITTVDGVNVVDFGSAASRFYWIENLGSTVVYVSGNENIVPDGDNVKVLSAGCGTMVENLGGKVYILGAGKFQITNQGDKFPPFRNAPVADGGVMASGNPVQIDGLQEGVPFSEITVSGKNLFDFRYSAVPTGITVEKQNDGGLKIYGKMERDAAWGINLILKNPLPKGKTYTLSINPDVIGILPIGVYYIGAAKENQTFIWNRDEYFTVYLNIQPNVDYDFVFRPQLELGDTATAYEPPITGRELTVNVNGTDYTITPDTNPYIIPNDIRQQDGLNVVSVSEGEISVTGVRKNAAVKKIWDKLDELTTAIIVSNGETIE